MDINMIIKSITLDSNNRIIVNFQEHLIEYLKGDEVKSTLKNSTQNLLGDDFVLFEMSSKSSRITVKEGSEQASIEKIKAEILRNLELAMQFMNSQNM